jgi:hypothetical protein
MLVWLSLTSPAATLSAAHSLSAPSAPSCTRQLLAAALVLAQASHLAAQRQGPASASAHTQQQQLQGWCMTAGRAPPGGTSRRQQQQKQQPHTLMRALAGGQQADRGNSAVAAAAAADAVGHAMAHTPDSTGSVSHNAFQSDG